MQCIVMEKHSNQIKAQRRAARYACNNYTERTPGCATAMVSSL